jgi:hypothetical protein
MVVQVVADRPVVAVDGVIAAPEDATVGGQAVVVKLVARGSDPPGAGAHRSTRLCDADSGSVINA